jgi:predicted PurR-regulated permease PerM
MKWDSRTVWIILGILALGALCYVFSTILIYLIVSAVIGFIGDPVVTFLRRMRLGKWNIPGWLAAGITLLLFVAFFTGIIGLFIPLVVREVNMISSMNSEVIVAGLMERLNAFTVWLSGLGLSFSADELYRTFVDQLTGAISLDGLTIAANNVFAVAGNFIAGFFSVLFMSFFFLKDGSLFYKMVFTVTPRRYMEKVKNILTHSHRMLSRYFIGLLVQVLIIMVVVSLGLTVLGVRNALIIGVFAGLANVIPYIGPVISTVFALLVGITTGIAAEPDLVVTTLILKILAVFGVAQFLDNWVIQPLVLGSSVNVHPLELFIVFLAAATVGGILGMALALPVYTILRITAREFFNEFKVVETLTRDLDD